MSLIELLLVTPQTSTQLALATELDDKVGIHNVGYRVNRNTRAFDDIMFVYNAAKRVETSIEEFPTRQRLMASGGGSSGSASAGGFLDECTCVPHFPNPNFFDVSCPNSPDRNDCPNDCPNDFDCPPPEFDDEPACSEPEMPYTVGCRVDVTDGVEPRRRRGQSLQSMSHAEKIVYGVV